MKKLLLAILFLIPSFASAQQFIPFLSWSYATGTQATTTSLFSTKGNFTNLCISQDCKTAWPSSAASSTLLADTNYFSGQNTFPNLIFTNATGTNATTSSLYVSGKSTLIGNVGIGTTGPNYKLEVNGTSGFTGNMVFTTDNTYDIGASGATRPRTGYFGTALALGGTPATTGTLRLNNAGSFKIRNAGNTADFEIITVTASDVLEIGTGTLLSSIVFNENGSDTDFRIESDTDANMFFVDAGNNRIGIGTASPATTLHVDASGGAIIRATRLASGAGVIQLEADGTDGTLTTTNQMLFRTNAGERMRIDTSGNVGISDTSPINLLTLRASTISGTSATVGIKQAGSGDGFASQAQLNDDFVRMRHSGTLGILESSYQSSGAYTPVAILTSDTERLRVAVAGEVGIGRTPTSGFLLDVAGIVRSISASPALEWNDTDNNGDNRIRQVGAETILDIDYNAEVASSAFGIYLDGTAGSNLALAIDSNKDVGIGTSSPSGIFSLVGSSFTQLYIASSTASAASSTLFMVDRAGDIHLGGGTPTLSSCGTGPAFDGNSTDQAGTVTVGATGTGCTVTWSTPKQTSPHCIVTPQTGSVTNTFSYTESTTALVVTETGLGGNKFDYACFLGH